MSKYEIIIYWSEQDEIFVAEMPELKGCIAHGDTQDEALKQVNEVATEWMRLANEKGWQIPQPKGKLIFA
ncbi:MAG: type II toxin-antitoxin system HicB family antitoxin [Chitinophagaceae bacterium]|nr:type II toxin-antitoxin system HicB family antitoxin [Chitinophagaceae bacterium]